MTTDDVCDAQHGFPADRTLATAPESEQERHARVVWSHIAEPDDPIALLARARLGPGGALTMLEEATPREVLEALAATDGRVGSDDPRDCSEDTAQRTRGRGGPGIDLQGILAAPAGDLRQVTAALERWRVRLDTLGLAAVLALAERRGLRILIPGDPGWPA